MLRIDGGLFFATAEAVDERVRTLTDDRPGLRTLVLDLEGVNFIDAQGASKLGEVQGIHRRGRAHAATGPRQPQVLDVLRAEGFLDRIGSDHVHGSVHRAVEAHAAEVREAQGG